MSKGLNRSRRVATLAILAALILGLAALLAACGGSGSTTTTTTTAGSTTTTTTTAAASTTTAAPPTTAGPDGGSTTTTVATTPVSLSDADKTFMQALIKSVQGNTQPLLDLGSFMVGYETATDAELATAEENIKKMGLWVAEVKAMTPSAGLKDTHTVLVQALDEFQRGFTDFVAAVKAKDTAKIQEATTIITTASMKYQSFGQTFGALANQ
jgi:hypothetical protein